MKSLFVIILLCFCVLSGAKGQVIPPVKADSLKTSNDTIKVAADTIVAVPVSPAAVAEPVTEKAAKKQDQAGPSKIAKNIFKFNITTALIKNYSLQYERVLTRTISVALTGRFMPESNIPYTDYIIRWGGITDPDVQAVLEGILTSNYTITPEIRFYTGKKRYGTGFYFSLFYRYGDYSFNNTIINLETGIGDPYTMDYSGDVTSHTGGIMIGSQFALGKHICLDWWIIGAHFGVSSGDIQGLASIPLSLEDQQTIMDNLNGIEIPMFKQTVEVNSNGARMLFDGPWAGIRMGLSFGVKF